MDVNRAAQLEALLEKVRLMRERQKSYFKTRSPADLDGSRQLEREVDRMVSELVARQGRLL